MSWLHRLRRWFGTGGTGNRGSNWYFTDNGRWLQVWELDIKWLETAVFGRSTRLHLFFSRFPQYVSFPAFVERLPVLELTLEMEKTHQSQGIAGTGGRWCRW